MPIEDSYPLTPLQEGMLYHAVSAPAAGADVEQMVLTLCEEVNPAALRAAWERVAARYAVLRTSFRWEGLDEPQQQVHDAVTLPWREEDLRPLTPEEREARLAEYLRADRIVPFALDRAPLMRFALFRFGDADYSLVWTFHHILLDGRSFPVLLREAFDRGAAALPPPRPYRDYIDWLQQRDPAAAEDYWRGLLTGFTAPTSLGLSPPAAPGSGHGEAELDLGAATVAGLKAFADATNVTINTIVHGAWALLLSRYSGEDDVVFGNTRAGRYWSADGARDMVGLFINTLPVRVRVPPDAAVGPWLRALREQHVAVRDHEHASLPEVHRWSDVEGGAPLFETLVVFETYRLIDALREHDAAWRQREIEIFEQTTLPLTLAAYLDETLVLTLEYDRARFTAADAAAMLGHVGTLLAGLVANADRRLVDVPMLTADEERLLLETWNDTAADFPREQTIDQLVAAQAARTPEAPAVAHVGRCWTHAELEAAGNRVAHHLIDLGVEAGARVGLCLDRSLEMTAALLGILKAGAAYVPLDPEYPRERLEHILADAAPVAVVTQSSLAGALPPVDAKVVLVDRDWPAIAARSDAPPPARATPDGIAYVVYTSGSTGKPKGVPIRHRGVVNLVTAAARLYGFRADDRLLQLSTVNFDTAVEEIFTTLTSGGTLVLRTKEMIASTATFANAVEANRITILDLSTAFWHEWVHGLGLLNRRVPECLRLVIVGGEKASAAVYQAWCAAGGDRARWVNTYGPTETTVVASYYIAPGDGLPPGEVAIGRPLPNVRLYVVDKHGRLAPPGAAGELHIGGVGVAPGYLNRPDLTAERFVPDPWANEPGATMYRTGDLVRHRPDGNLEFLGRVDFQVKVRGFRIELGEIEAALERHAQVGEAVVLTLGRESEDKRLVAYFIPVGAAPSADELRAFIKEHLPEYMAPSQFVPLDAFPLTPNGKVDRKRLPDPSCEAAPAVGVTRARTPVEETLARIWAEVLGLAEVGVDNNFFDLGGHSLLTIKVIDRAHQAGLDIRPQQFFQHPTIAALAQEIELARRKESEGEEWSSLVPLRAAGARPALYLVHTTPGDLLGYGNLVHLLGPDQPCYGLQSLGLHDPDQCHRSIEEMAGYYVEQLRRHQPDGPYLLGGWCYGGIVAYEMAQRLTAQGAAVGLLALIDAWAPPPRQGRPRYWLGRLGRFAAMGPRGWLRYIVGKARYLRRIRREGTADVLKGTFARGPLANRERVYQENMAAVLRYRARPYAGKVTLFVSRDRGEETIPDEVMGWTGLVPEVESYVLPCEHHTILQEPGAGILSDRLAACIRRLRAAP